MTHDQKRILVVVHKSCTMTGRIGFKLEERGYEIDCCCPVMGDALPENVSDYSGTIVFGGPMSANDDHIEGIRRELDWIPRVLDAQIPYLGICLGGQLLAKVAGAKISRHEDDFNEIGFYDLFPTETGKELFEENQKVYHWHNEGFETPKTATKLAGGSTFENQAFRLSDRFYGFQFHPEANEAIINRWLTRDGHMIDISKNSQAEGEQRKMISDQLPKMDKWADRFLDHWLKKVA